MDKTPIYNALCSYNQNNYLRLHMPGHVGGKALPAEFAGLALKDLTEVEGLDDLHLPQGVIEQSQRLLAEAVGARESFFLVNGASSGIHAMIMSIAGYGDSILIPRNAHRSFYGGLVLSGAQPVYLPCQIDPELGVAISVGSRDIDEAIALNPDIKAVFITTPSYYGTCSDLAGAVQTANQKGKPVMVDEAHGAHFPFHPDYPVPAIKQGAAAVVNGLHKTWPVLNQGAALHISPDFGYRDRLRQAVSLLTTTSPSYPLMASIELARVFMEQKGYELLDRARLLSYQYKSKISQIKGLKVYGDELIDKDKIVGLDPLKIVVSTRELNITGYQLGRILREKYKIQLEMENEALIMAMFSPLHEEQDWEKFYRGLKDTAAVYGCSRRDRVEILTPPSCRTVMSPRRAFLAAKDTVPLMESRGMIAGEIIAAYPPGIPCLLPGELISEAVLDYLQYIKNNHYRIQGPEDRFLNYIKVIEQN